VSSLGPPRSITRSAASSTASSATVFGRIPKAGERVDYRGFTLEVVDAERRHAAIACLRDAQVSLPTWSELADPAHISDAVGTSLKSVGPDEADARNLWRVHWFNSADRRHRLALPGYVVLPPALTGVKAPIIVLLGRRFPMIGAHKVLAAYSCLAPRVVMNVRVRALEITVAPARLQT